MVKGAKLKSAEIKREWYQIDAKDKVLGRMASQIAQLLQGKNKPYYVPHLDCGDHVVVVNAKDVKVTGSKSKIKVYYSHSNYPGGLKKQTFSQLLAKDPEEIIYRAVWGMIPKTKLGRAIINKLHIFASGNHPYQNKISKVS